MSAALPIAAVRIDIMPFHSLRVSGRTHSVWRLEHNLTRSMLGRNGSTSAKTRECRYARVQCLHAAAASPGRLESEGTLGPASSRGGPKGLAARSSSATPRPKGAARGSATGRKAGCQDATPIGLAGEASLATKGRTAATRPGAAHEADGAAEGGGPSRTTVGVVSTPGGPMPATGA